MIILKINIHKTIIYVIHDNDSFHKPFCFTNYFSIIPNEPCISKIKEISRLCNCASPINSLLFQMNLAYPKSRRFVHFVAWPSLDFRCTMYH